MCNRLRQWRNQNIFNQSNVSGHASVNQGEGQRESGSGEPPVRFRAEPLVGDQVIRRPEAEIF